MDSGRRPMNALLKASLVAHERSSCLPTTLRASRAQSSHSYWKAFAFSNSASVAKLVSSESEYPAMTCTKSNMSGIRLLGISNALESPAPKR
jgi:hypothetical protein